MDFLEAPNEEAEIQPKASRRGKNLTLSENTSTEKEQLLSKVTPKKVGGVLKGRDELNKRRCE